MNLIVFNRVRALGLAAALLLLAPLSGCSFFQSSPTAPPADTAAADTAPAPTPVNDETNLAASFKADTIHAGDGITITFSGLSTPPPPHEEQVRDDGQIKPPLLTQPVMAAGKTVGELQDELERLYVPDYFKAVTIVITIKERYYWVGGEVKMGGQKPYLSQMTVLKAVQAAGDVTNFGDRKRVRVTRTDGTVVVVDCKKAIKTPKFDLPVYPGDVIHVPPRW